MGWPDVGSHYDDAAYAVPATSAVSHHSATSSSLVKTRRNLLVECVNMVTKHAKPSMANQQGGILHQEGPIDASNVMFLHKGKATRVGFKMDGDKKVRYAKSTGDVID